MNLQRVFEAVRQEPDQMTLLVAVGEFERQGYTLTVNDKYRGYDSLVQAEEEGYLENLLSRNGVILKLEKDKEVQVLRMHFLDIDAVCFSDADTLPVIFDPQFTTEPHKTGEMN